MTLRKKTFLIVGATLLVLSAALYGASRLIISRGFDDAERYDVEQNVSRVRDVLDDEISSLEGLTRDSATWSDTIGLLKGQKGIESRLNREDSFINFRINVMMLVDADGNLVFLKAFDLRSNTEVPIPADIQKRLADNSPLVEQARSGTVLKGMLVQPEAVFMIVSQPIVEEGRMLGTLMWGRALDDKEVDYISRLTHLSVGIEEPGNAFLPDDYRLAREALEQSAPLHVQPLDEESIAGYTLIHDINQEPILILKVQMPRPIHSQAITTNRYLFFSLIAMGLIFGLMTVLPLERWVISRMARLSADVSDIGASGSADAVVRINGRDEVSKLASVINGMLGTLERSHLNLRQANTQLSRQVAVLRALAEIGREIASKNESRSVIDLVCARAAELLDLPKSLIVLKEKPFQAAAIHGLKHPGLFSGFPYLFSSDRFMRRDAGRRGPVRYAAEDLQKLLLPEFCERERIVSAVEIPLAANDEVLGSLMVFDTRDHDWIPDELQALELLAGHAALALDEARMFEDEQSRRAELGSLYALSRELANAEMDTDSILELVVGHAVDTVHITFARAVLVEQGRLVVRAAHPARMLYQDLRREFSAPGDEAIFLHEIIRRDTATVISRSDPGLTEHQKRELFLDIAQTVCLVPLKTGDDPIGLLILGEERQQERDTFTDEKIRLAISIGDQTASALRRGELFSRIERAYLETVLALANAVDAKDTYTGNHGRQLAEIALKLGKVMGLTVAELEDLQYGAILHDIGKIGVPDVTLKKPGRLTELDWSHIRNHPAIGEQILTPVPPLAGAAKIVRHHHEHYDGKGYPDGIAEDDIPLGARILTVVDSFCTIMDKRGYKNAGSRSQAVAELRRCAGSQFDPVIVATFIELLEAGEIRAA